MTATKLGRIQSCPPLRPGRLHVHDGRPLREAEHEIPVPVLDQEDLIAQGIDTSALVPGAARVDALGSCTANAGTGHLAERWAAEDWPLSGIGIPGTSTTLDRAGAVECEEFAIVLYAHVTGQTGDPASEWPPADCGSSGFYVCEELERLGIAAGYRSASTVTGALSMLQDGTVMQGLPWFQAWFAPDAHGFVDGDGSYGALEAAIASGVAGGHETLLYGIPQLAQRADGTIDLTRTVIRVRNSWSARWGLSGDYLIHASTLDYLTQYADWKQIVVGAFTS